MSFNSNFKGKCGFPRSRWLHQRSNLLVSKTRKIIDKVMMNIIQKKKKNHIQL